MHAVFRGKQGVKAGTLFLLGWMSLVSVGCGSRQEEKSPPGLSASQNAGSGQEGAAPSGMKTIQAPSPPGTTATPSDTFVKPGG